MKLVFDTNVYISAFAIPKSKAEKAFLKVIESGDVLLISKDTLKEILTVLSTKFNQDREALSHLAVYVSGLARMVEVTGPKLRVLNNEPDNRIVECAIAGGADIIVTGDKEMLKLKEFKSVRIIGLREYLEG
ncbi:MAG: PIN domain protein [Syntrophorhabdus sp. PtaU1.Bin050]|nr:MAG: PIN domain protein [Syntrophorhabdus sp. PtaU1.Bin050]